MKEIGEGYIKKFIGLIWIFLFFAMGCVQKKAEIEEINSEINIISSLDKSDHVNAEDVAAAYHDIYDDAVETNTLGTLEVTQRIISRLGENGYIAVDSQNQVDMVGAERTVEFCRAVDEKKEDKISIIVILGLGFRKFDLTTEEGNVNVVRGYYQYDKDGYLENRSTVSYWADKWQYTEEGYLLFEGSYFSNENMLTLSDAQEQTAIRIAPLDETCRELNRAYILPIGYQRNNMFLMDWSEDQFGNLDFYDIFDVFYPVLNKQPVPYAADENLGIGTVYQIPENEFETVVMTYFDIDKEMLRSKTTYSLENAAYEYRPRGFYEMEYPDLPYPEVVSYTENRDGTITLIIHAVYPQGGTSKLFSHKTVIRPLKEDHYQYVSNQVISPEDDYDIWWHSDRLTEEEWEQIYGGNEE